MTTVNCFPTFGGPSSETETRKYKSQKEKEIIKRKYKSSQRQNILFLII